MKKEKALGGPILNATAMHRAQELGCAEASSEFPGSPEQEGEGRWRLVVCSKFFTGVLNTLNSFAVFLLLLTASFHGMTEFSRDN